jgi:hypothetical protein
VLFRAGYEDRTVRILTGPMPSDSLQLTLPSARLGFNYQIFDWLALAVQSDLANRPLLRDAYMAARSKRLKGRVGQFKMPSSTLAMTSIWQLPVAHRGVIHSLLRNRMGVVGRSPGAMGSVRGEGGLDPELAVGVFQGSFLSAGARTLIGQGVDAQNIVARFSVTPGGQELAIGGQRVSTLNPKFQQRHDWAGSAGAALDEPFGARGLRIWLDGMAGSTYLHEPTGTEVRDALYWTARGILAWRYGGEKKNDGYGEPFVSYGVLDPEMDRADDLFWEAAAGVNVGYWRVVKLSLQFDLARSQPSVPRFLFPDGRTLEDHKAVLVQVGAAF